MNNIKIIREYTKWNHLVVIIAIIRNSQSFAICMRDHRKKKVN